MEQDVLDFLLQNTTCVLSVAMPNGLVHGATLHYAHHNLPLEIYFSTKNTSIKFQALEKGTTKASFVVGVSDETWKTIQMDGEVEVVKNEEEIKKIKEIFYTKLPNDKNFISETTVYLRFIPSWWRYSDYSKRPPLILPLDSC